MAKNNAKILDISTLIAAGINPATGLPIKMGDIRSPKCGNIQKVLRIIDEQDAINRYQWYNLPDGIDSQLLERVLYYKGQAAFFFNEATGKFFFLPYALSGTIDIYGRFNKITPLPFGGGKADADDSKKAYSSADKWLMNLTLDVIKEAQTEDKITYDMLTNGCVLLHDYCKQISQTNIARQILNDPILELMAEAYPMARTAMLANSGIKAMRVQDQDQEQNVKLASQSVQNAAMSGDPFIPIVGTVNFQELTNNGSALKAQEFLLYMQSLDNFRLKTYGLDNGGIFEKSAHTLESEQSMNVGGQQSRVYQDGLTIRQNFCDIVNSVWGLGIWCEPAQSAIGDLDMDGAAVDEKDQSGTVPGEQPVEESDNVE